MMTHRVLPPDEWERLEGTPLGEVWTKLPTTGVTVIVVEDAEGQIVGHWTEFLCPHAEQVWVHPDHRKRGVVVARLLAQMRETVETSGAQGFITFSASEEVTTLLETLGATRLPGDGYSVPTRKG